jgi:hypothetical protein
VGEGRKFGRTGNRSDIDKHWYDLRDDGFLRIEVDR